MSILHDAWRLARPYFRSAEGRRAWLLLGIVLALNLALTGLDVVLNYWNGAFWTALQQRDATGFFRLLFLWNGAMPGWLLLTLPYVALTVLDAWLVQRMQIDWRRWMTGEFLGRFLADRAYYQLGLTRDPTSDAGADNPDQRIAEDVASFCTATLSLGVDLFSSAISLASFVAVLWRLSSGLQFFGVAIPGSMVWIALLFATCGSALAHIVGRPLIALDFARERAEANFRFGLMRLRENAAAVALLRGEPAERTRLDARFGAIMTNWLALIRRRAMLSGTLLVFTQAEGIVPSVIAAPAWFAGRIAFGTLTRIAGAFAQVSSALSWFINAYPSLAAWAATVRRLSSFERAMAAARATTGIQHVPGTSVATENLRLTLPDGTALLSLENLHFPPASATLLHGPNGAGKSTLLRAIAGVWPFGTGTVTLPPGRMMLLPQQPYLPQGSLRAALCYPSAACTDDDLANALAAVGLGNLIARLEDIQDWGHILSGGEQQRLCLAGALAQRPDILFLDEATASLDPMDEAAIYRHLRASLPHTTIISIGHRAHLAALHDRVLPIGGQASVLAEEGSPGLCPGPAGA